MHPHRHALLFSLWASLLICSASKALAMNAVYLESNARDSNEVALLIQARDGASLDFIRAFSTAGAGEPAIDGNQSHALATNGKFLFVTNTGDDSVSTFRIEASGNLNLLGKTSSLGRHPVSLAVVQNNLLVLNQGDNNRQSPVNPNVQRYRILHDGQLVALQGSFSYLPDAVPVDIIGSPKGRTFTVTLSGLSQVDRFDLEKDGSISRTGTTGGINNPLGGAIGRYNPHKLAVTLADNSLPGIASLYTNLNGMTQRVFQSIRSSLMDPCWAVSNAHSTWLWTSAFETRTLSLYRWEANGNIRFVSDYTPEMTGPGGLDLAISENDKTLFWLRVGDVENTQRPMRPFIESFAVNTSTYSATAGLTLISKTMLPENWSFASPGGILSLTIKP